MSDNLWNKDRKKLFRELYHQYMEEGYESKEAKRLAKEEAEEMMAEYEDHRDLHSFPTRPLPILRFY